jgi:hypothetical protein
MVWDEGAAEPRAAIAGMHGRGRLPGDERRDDGCTARAGADQ